MKKIFVCSPFSEGKKEDNLNRTKEICRSICLAGDIPFAPHLFFPLFLEDSREEERRLGISSGKVFLKECDEVWIFLKEDGSLSNGMREELQLALDLNKPVIFHVHDDLHSNK